jgi:phytoene dehydrogenase-like protein
LSSLLADEDRSSTESSSSFRRKRRDDREGDVLTALPSFVHLHLAFEANDEFMSSLPNALEANYVSVVSWDAIDDPQNVVLISMPSVVDKTCAPEGYHILHAYTPATEPYELWEGVKSKEEYEALKNERCKCLWEAVEKIIPDAREKAIVTMEGSPLTHERFLNVHRGTYGPEIDAGGDGVELLPGQKRSDIADCLWAVGHSTFPGIGVPAVAASGWIAANGLTDVESHERVLRAIGLL